MNNSNIEETEILFKTKDGIGDFSSFSIPKHDFNFVEIEFIEKSGSVDGLYIHPNGNIALKITKGDKIGVAGSEVKISITKPGSVSFRYKTSNTLKA